MTQVIQNTATSALETRKARRAGRRSGTKGLRGTLLRALGQDQRGAAAVEFAFIMPILLVMFSGILQFGSVMFLENHMTNVAREASRRVAVGELTETDAATMVQGALVNWGVTYEVSVATVDADDGNQDITVAISLPLSDAALIDVLGLFDTGNLSTSVTMRMES
jgi:Flp pilus assembly protein TadG